MKNSRKPWANWMIFLASLVIVFFIGFIISSIASRKTEARLAFTPNVDINEFEPRNEVWGEFFPRQYQSYANPDTTFKSKYMGGAMVDLLELKPEFIVLWAGFGFSKDYNQGRAHGFAIEDIRNSLRTGAPTGPDDGPMPSACWSCKSSDVPRLINEMGTKAYYDGTWASMGAEHVNAIGCANCHDANTMSLTITQPALIDAYERMGKDITKASLNEMRSLTCAQCHSEYYFKKTIPGKEGIPYLFFPWDHGLKVEDMERYYDEVGFVEWVHPLSRAPMLKVQHPGYELHVFGIHGRKGVSCADCHMPYKTEGGLKFTDHNVQSPLNNIANSCQVCHRESEDVLRQYVYDNQDRIYEILDKLGTLLVRTHVEAKLCWDLGATEEQMKDILHGIRIGQWRWDYAAASHGATFHAPIELGRIIAKGTDITQETRIKLARLLHELGFKGEVPYPNIKTKEDAWALIGFPAEEAEAQKERFLRELAPEWDKEAEERESKY